MVSFFDVMNRLVIRGIALAVRASRSKILATGALYNE